MSLVSDLITDSWLDIDEIRVGRLIAAPEQADSFARLNQIISQWSREELTVYTTVHQSFTPTAGVTDYTLGTGGSFVTASIPIRVTSAMGMQLPFSGPVEVLSYAAFTERVKNGRGRSTVLAELLAADNAYPAINLRIHPVPAAAPGTLALSYWIALPQFATVGDTIALPPGFERALRLALAVDLFPVYARHARPNAFEILAASAQEAKKSIVALNAEVLGARTQAPPPQMKAA
jgi:hypothetical protein